MEYALCLIDSCFGFYNNWPTTCCKTKIIPSFCAVSRHLYNIWNVVKIAKLPGCIFTLQNTVPTELPCLCGANPRDSAQNLPQQICRALSPTAVPPPHLQLCFWWPVRGSKWSQLVSVVMTKHRGLQPFRALEIMDQILRWPHQEISSNLHQLRIWAYKQELNIRACFTFHLHLVQSFKQVERGSKPLSHRNGSSWSSLCIAVIEPDSPLLPLCKCGVIPLKTMELNWCEWKEKWAPKTWQ